jgi:hypothetical protein
MTLTLDKNQAYALYALLRRETKLSTSLVSLQNQLEPLVFQLITLEELDNLDNFITHN